jgi:hypothetical protein
LFHLPNNNNKNNYHSSETGVTANYPENALLNMGTFY